MHFVKYIILCLVLFHGSSAFAQEEAQPTLYGYVNINANVQNTKILLDGEEIGTTPIKAYKVEAGKPLEFTAIANKEYYKKDLTKRVNLIKNTQKDIDFKFEKAQAKLFFIGDKAHLFINNKFIRELNENNRVVKVDAGKNIEIYLEDGYKTRMLFKDIKADMFYEVPYTLINIPKDIRLYTTTVENLMWEDTEHAASMKIDWDNANEYCEDLKLAGFTDWKLPSIEQLTRLEERYKDKIYYGHGDSFYWSTDTSISENEIWSYADSRDFEKSKTKKPIKELPIGYVRCVRELPLTSTVQETQQVNGSVKALNETSTNEKQQQVSENGVKMLDEELSEEEREKLGYDPNLTKDLDRYMLK